MSNDQPSAAQPSPRIVLAAIAWLAAVGVMVLIRYRGNFAPYMSFHRWLADLGLADWVRNTDTQALTIVGVVPIWLFLFLKIRSSSKGFLSDMGILRSPLHGFVVGLVIGLPMLLCGVVFGLDGSFEWKMLVTVVIGPFAEEWFFRGILVLAMVRLTGVNFWTAAIVNAFLFGAVHIQWSLQGVASGWGSFIATFAGGVWYAWLAREWSRNLWVVIFLHAFMNLAGYWYDGGHGAAGSLLLNIGRGATIAFGTVMTIYPQWFRMAWARTDDARQA